MQRNMGPGPSDAGIRRSHNAIGIGGLLSESTPGLSLCWHRACPPSRYPLAPIERFVYWPRSAVPILRKTPCVVLARRYGGIPGAATPTAWNVGSLTVQTVQAIHRPSIAACTGEVPAVRPPPFSRPYVDRWTECRWSESRLFEDPEI